MLHLNTKMRELTATGLSFQEAIASLKDMNPLEFVNIVNASPCDEEPDLPVRTFSERLLNPAPEQDIVSPFLSTAFLPKNRQRFMLHQRIREVAATKHWKSVHNLLTHFERKQWPLFDRQWEQLEIGGRIDSENDRIRAAFRAIEEWEKVFAPGTDGAKERVKQRLALGRATSHPLMKDLIDHFKAKGKDESMYRELVEIRDRWAKHYLYLSPVYLRFYWDDEKHSLKDYAVTEKKFEELKLLYVEVFETFCRISVIAAGIEGIIHKRQVGIPLAKRVMNLDEFDATANGTKREILKQLIIADLFVPFIDNKLRNGIGHNSAHYEVANDLIRYRVENDKGIQNLTISYTEFCETLVTLFRQLHVVSIYVHWLRQSTLGVV
jgi:hypothetical protein